MEWIDPQYADLMKHLKRVRAQRQQRGDDRPVRSFILPPQPGKH